VTELPPAAGCAACAARDQVIAELGRAVEELRAEVAELRRRLGRNSRNSSMPPSSDDLPGRVPPRRERRKGGTGRRRGKQPGSPGAAMSWAEPDEIADQRRPGPAMAAGAILPGRRTWAWCDPCSSLRCRRCPRGVSSMTCTRSAAAAGREVRHVNSYLASQLTRERQCDMLAQAGQQRLAGLAPLSRRAERRMALRLRSELEQ
jgi:Family of unknown function (DUF6444)